MKLQIYRFKSEMSLKVSKILERGERGGIEKIKKIKRRGQKISKKENLNGGIKTRILK